LGIVGGMLVQLGVFDGFDWKTICWRDGASIIFFMTSFFIFFKFYRYFIALLI